MPAHAVGDGAQRRGIVEHAGLGRGDAKILGDGIDLLANELRRHGMNRRHAARILRGQGGEDAGAVDAERGERLEVGLNAGAAGGIGARDGERDGPCSRRGSVGHMLICLTAAACRAA